MEIIDDLNWVFTFGKHKYQTIKGAILTNPSTSSDGVTDIKGKQHWQGLNLILTDSLISYLEWAEKEEILKVTPKAWKDIKHFDSLYTKIKSYENGNTKISPDDYKKSLLKFNEINNLESNYQDCDSEADDSEILEEPRYDWLLNTEGNYLEFKQLPLHEAITGKGFTMEEHKKRGSHMFPLTTDE